MKISCKVSVLNPKGFWFTSNKAEYYLKMAKTSDCELGGFAKQIQAGWFLHPILPMNCESCNSARQVIVTWTMKERDGLCIEVLFYKKQDGGNSNRRSSLLQTQGHLSYIYIQVASSNTKLGHTYHLTCKASWWLHTTGTISLRWILRNSGTVSGCKTIN